ncbi:T9SS type A sorting domain-containing protein [Rurimicrobium arvi]|uniref:Secretion system C-terminal sorting domain-containing protein n=1 Tax=Rurimicrobium arvi TaxID=2049916 RepID=A0ABP8MFR1_9BACT
MKKLLYSLLLLLCCSPVLQAQSVSACTFVFLDTNYIVTSGANPGSMLDFHAESGGGKRLMRLVADADGKAAYKSQSHIDARIVANVQNEFTGAEGNRQVAVIEENTFSVRELHLDNTLGTGTLTCKTSAAQNDAFRLVLLGRSKGNPVFVKIAETPLLVTETNFNWYRGEAAAEDEYKLAVYAKTGEEYISSAVFAFAQNDKFVISPNPVSDILRISGKFEADHYRQWSILDVSGKVLLSGTDVSCLKDKGLKVGSLQPGTYILKLMGKTDSNPSFSFVKQ